MFVILLILILSDQIYSAGLNISYSTGLNVEYYTGLNISYRFYKHTLNQQNNIRVNFPTSYDWRYVSGDIPIRNQAGCGSCWAFGTIGPIEFLIKDKTGQIIDLSEQALISCNSVGYTCNSGGWWAFNDLKNNGIIFENDLPYAGKDMKCPNNIIPISFIKVVNWGYVDAWGGIPSINKIKSALLEYGPISSGVFVSNEFYSYSSGVFTANYLYNVNHAVVIIGWDDNLNSWLIRNSWGAGWGMKGYMFIDYKVSSIGDGAAFVVIDVDKCIPEKSPKSSSISPSISSSISPSPNFRNDICINSKIIYCNTEVYDSTIQIRQSNLDNCHKVMTEGYGVWFTLDINNIYSLIEINTFKSNYDTQLSIYSGNNCNELICIDTNDDASFVYQSKLVLNTKNIGKIFIVVHGYASSVGLVNLAIICS